MIAPSRLFTTASLFHRSSSFFLLQATVFQFPAPSLILVGYAFPCVCKSPESSGFLALRLLFPASISSSDPIVTFPTLDCICGLSQRTLFQSHVDPSRCIDRSYATLSIPVMRSKSIVRFVTCNSDSLCQSCTTILVRLRFESRTNQIMICTGLGSQSDRSYRV